MSRYYRKNIPPQEQFENIARALGNFIDEEVVKGQYQNEAHAVANVILKDVTYTHPRYNNWSGNLNRSYYVAIALGKESYIFGVNPATIKGSKLYDHNEVLERKGYKVNKDTETYRDHKGEERFTNSSFYYRNTRERHQVRGRWHLKDKNGKFYRKLSESPGYPEQQFDKQHQYYDELRTRSRRQLTGTSKPNKYNSGGFGVGVGNLTPYRRLVEAKGYRVLHGGDISRWMHYIEATLGKSMKIKMNQLAYLFQKGKPTWVPDKGFEHRRFKGNRNFGHYVQPSGYASPRRNSKLVYKDRLY